MDDDFNTAAALGHVSELLTLANKLLDQPKSAPKPVRRSTLEAITAGLAEVAEVLGVYGQDPDPYLLRRRERLCKRHGIDAAEVEARLTERAEARKAKDFARADGIREELAALRVEVMDTASGWSWRVLEG
jgi:cysteinyl-tRNA synthetase